MVRLSHERFNEVLRKVLGDCAAVIAKLKTARGVLGFFKVAPGVIRAVEGIAADVKMVSEDKKALAVRAILVLVPDRWIPDVIIEPIVGFIVELALSRLKKTGEI